MARPLFRIERDGGCVIIGVLLQAMSNQGREKKRLSGVQVFDRVARKVGGF